ncbi:sigma-70 family RNA polymerase sigma factor [Thalassoglobus sp. JC818]|uniref:sigma-70 family RNA polymerase sigma factor n=1 Tax=Thalassoglobus sp. JC818 TaxID=3232136 RepID=UPI003458C564
MKELAEVEPYLIEICNEEQSLFRGQFSAPLELGRQRVDEEPPFALVEEDQRLVIAGIEDRTVSRHQLQVTREVDGSITIQNISTTASVRHPDGTKFRPGESLIAESVQQFYLKNMRIIVASSEALLDEFLDEESSLGSVSVLLTDLTALDQDAIQRLFEKYYLPMVKFARSKMAGISRRVADEEDIAQSAFHSFCSSAMAGNFPELNDRDNLWRILTTLINRKVIDHYHHDRRQKRGGGVVRGDSVFLGGTESGPVGIVEWADNEPTPEAAAEMAETCCLLLDQLGDDNLKNVALMKLEGHTNDEIAEHLKSSRRTVHRWLKQIRDKWS